MNRPSRFQTFKWPQNIYQQNYLFKATIQQRFMISKTLIRQQSYNLHLGIDFINRCEVIIISILEREISSWEAKTKDLPYSAELIWQGCTFLQKNKYCFKIYKKKGTLLSEFLGDGHLTVERLYVILVLLIQLLSKIHRNKGNFKFFQLKSLQLVQDQNTKQLILMTYSSPCLQFRNASATCIIQSSVNGMKKIYSRNNKPEPKSQHGADTVPSNKRDLKLILQKILQIKSQYYKGQDSSNLTGRQFEKFIATLIKQSEKIHEIANPAVQRYFQLLKKIIQQQKINIKNEMEEMKKIVNMRKEKNQINLELFCKNFNEINQREEELEIEEDESMTDGGCFVEDEEVQISQHIENHTLKVKISKTF